MSIPVTPQPTSSPITSTKNDSRIVAARELYTASYRLLNVASILQDCVSVLSDPKSSGTKISEQLKHISNLVIPAVQLAANTLDRHGRHVSDIPGLKLQIERSEKMKAKEVVNLKKRKSEHVQLLKNYITPFSPVPVSMNHHPKRLRLTRSMAPSSKEVDIPEPMDGTQYTKFEMLNILEAIDADSGKRKKAILRMIKLQYVPYKKSAIYNMLRKRMEGKLVTDTEWASSCGGRPPLLDQATVQAIADEIQSDKGRAQGRDEINDIIVRHIKKMISNAGHVPLDVPEKLNHTTLNNYIAQLSLAPELTVVSNSIPKTNTRYAAENSIRGVISNLALIGSTHFYEVEEENEDFLKTLDELPKETRLFYDLNRRARPDVPIAPVLPNLKFSTDDTTQFIFDGHETKPDKFKLAPKDCLDERGTHSVYHVDEQKNMNGMRVKLTWTFSACGRCGPLFVTVTGLDDNEFPGEEDLLVVKIPGLCIGGGGVGSSKVEGFLCFQKKTPGADEKRFAYYQEHVMVPFINKIREEYSRKSFDASTGMAVPVELTAVSSLDGDVPQLNAIASNPELWTDNRIIVNKHNSGRTALDQPADQTYVFKDLSKVAKTTTVSDIDPEIHFMKKIVHDAFHGGLLNGLKLKSKTMRSLIDFISTLPEIATKIATRDSILHGFLSCGFIDEEKKEYPVFDKVMAGIRRTIPDHVYDAIVASYPRVLNEMLLHGHIRDDLFDELGFGRDVDAGGKEVLRNAGISQEHKQRAKCLTHDYQTEMRQAYIESIIAEKLPINAEFILAHYPNAEKKCEIPKNKGKLQVAKELLESRDYDAPLEKSDPLILWAYKCRNLPRKDKWIASVSPSQASVEDVPAPNDRSTIAEVVLDGGDHDGVKPSELLSDRLWISIVCRLFSVDEVAANLTIEAKERADLLVKLLRGRLTMFMNRRKVSNNKRNHWAIKLAYKNLSFVAAYMVLSGHVKTDLSCLNETKSLLSPDQNKFLLVSESYEEHEGAYLYFDANNWEFIRSGKVCGRGFKKRHNEHAKKAATAVNPESDFYLYFPTSDCVRANSPTTRGQFDKLTMHIAAGFKRTSEEASLIDRNHAEGGLMILNDTDKDNIKSSMKNSPGDLIKFQSFMAYEMELGYDLALSPAANVSRSFGFESFVGLFHN